MEKALFFITCTTCRARLAVRSAEVIGDISECPKCGLMVEIRPPAGFTAPQSGSELAHQRGTLPKNGQPSPREVQAPPREVQAPPREMKKPAPKAQTPPAPPVAVPRKSPQDSAAARPTPDPLVQTTFVAMAFCPMPDEIAAPPIVRLGGWLGLLARPAVKWLALGAAPLVGLGIVVGVWGIWSGRHSEPPAAAATQDKANAAVEQPPAKNEAKPAAASSLGRLDRRWLPDHAAWIFSLRGVGLAHQPQGDAVLAAADPLWRASVGAALDALGLTLDRVERLTWATADPTASPERSVLVIELVAGQDAAALASLGAPLDIGASGLICRQLAGPRWPHPMGIVDPQTIVTGDEAVLRRLAKRGAAGVESPPLDRLLDRMSPDADALLLIDLAAVRPSDGKLPTAMMDVWPAGKRAWRELWDLPAAAGFAATWRGRQRSEVALACQSETEAEMVRADLESLVAAAKDALPWHVASLQQALEAGRVTAKAADPYRQFLDDGRSALTAASWQVVDATVRLQLNWARSPLAAAASALSAAAAMHTDWLAAARKADEANHRRIVGGLSGRAKLPQGSFPAGAVGGILLEPDTRLSWIADMLPYYDHADWSRQLEIGLSVEQSAEQPHFAASAAGSGQSGDRSGEDRRPAFP